MENNSNIDKGVNLRIQALEIVQITYRTNDKRHFRRFTHGKYISLVYNNAIYAIFLDEQ